MKRAENEIIFTLSFLLIRMHVRRSIQSGKLLFCVRNSNFIGVLPCVTKEERDGPSTSCVQNVSFRPNKNVFQS